MQNRDRAQPAAQSKPGLRQLGRALVYLRHYQRTVWIAVAALVISIGAQLLVPQMVQNILDAVSLGMGTGTEAGRADVQAAAMQALVWSIVLIIVFGAARGVFAFLQAFLGEKLSQGIAYDLRNDLFAKIQRLSFSYHDRNRTGQLMVRATDDVEKLRLFLGQGLLMTLQSIILLTGALVLLVITNWRLTLVVLPILPIALVLFMAFGAITQPLFRTVQAKISALNTTLQESLAGIRVVKAFAREPHQIALFRQGADEVMHQQIIVARVLSFLFPMIFLVANLGQVAVLYYGGAQILGNTLTIGEWQKFSFYLNLCLFPRGPTGLYHRPDVPGERQRRAYL